MFDKVYLIEKMLSSFNDEEIVSLCFDLGYDLQDIPGGTRLKKIENLFSLIEKRQNDGFINHKLIPALKASRPYIDWDIVYLRTASMKITADERYHTTSMYFTVKSLIITSIPLIIILIYLLNISRSLITSVVTISSLTIECGKPYDFSRSTNLPIFEGFENKDITSFKPRNIWEIALDQQNNRVYAHKDNGIKDFSTFTLDNVSFDNFEVEFCFKVIDYVDKEPTGGEVFIHFRENINNSYRALFHRSYFTFQHYDGTNWKDLNKDISSLTLSKNVWYKVKIIANRSKFECYIDNKLIDSAEDVKIKNGSLKFGVGAFTTVYFDNIKITAIR